jgi:hypothetical protein
LREIVSYLIVYTDLPSWAPAVGAQGEPFDYVLEAGKLAEFAVAVEADPSGVPPTFLEAARFWRAPESVPWKPEGDVYGRTLHASQEFEFPTGVPAVGSRLTGQMRVDNVFAKVGRRSGLLVFVEIVTDFTDSVGELIAVSRQTTVTTERPPDGGSA